MTRYRCYFVSANHQICDFQDIACASEDEAAIQASAILGQAKDSSVELWEKDRLIAVFMR